MTYLEQIRKNREIIISGIYNRLDKMAEKAISISNSKPHNQTSSCKKCQHIFSMALEMRLLLIKAREIRNKPLHNFPSGGMATVIENLERGKEVIPHNYSLELSKEMNILADKFERLKQVVQK